MSSNKSFSTETSERYSRALFEVCIESNELDKSENAIKNFQSRAGLTPDGIIGPKTLSALEKGEESYVTIDNLNNNIMS